MVEKRRRKFGAGFGLFAFLSAMIGFAESSDARRSNPPGCRNANAAAHNPNCAGQTETHVAVPAQPTPVQVDTTTSSVGAGAISTSGGNTVGGTTSPDSGIVTGTYGKPITGFSPVISVTGSFGQAVTGFSPYMVPPDPILIPVLAPYMVPNPVPSAIPTRVPYLAPSLIVTGRYPPPVVGFHPYIAPVPSGTAGQTGGPAAAGGSVGGSVHMHVQNAGGNQENNQHVPPLPGNNMVPGYRAFFVGEDGQVSACMVSGLRRRVVVNQEGHESRAGHSETLHFRSATIAHLPSNRKRTNRCLVSIRKTLDTP